MNYIKMILCGILGFIIGTATVWNIVGATCSNPERQFIATSLWGSFQCSPVKVTK